MDFDCVFCDEAFQSREQLDQHSQIHIQVEVNKQCRQRLQKITPGSVDGYLISDLSPYLEIPENPLAPFQEFSNQSILPYSDAQMIQEAKALNLSGLYLTSFKESRNFQPWRLKSLVKLNLSENFLKDLDSISCLTSLTELKLRKNLVENVSPLQALEKVVFLDLGENQIQEISSIAFLTSLQELKIDSNLLASLIIVLDCLMTFSKLEHLYIDSNPFYSNTLNAFDWIASAVKLKTLNGQDLKGFNNSLTYKQVFRLRKALRTEEEQDRRLQLTSLTHISSGRTFRGLVSNMTLR